MLESKETFFLCPGFIFMSALTPRVGPPSLYLALHLQLTDREKEELLVGLRIYSRREAYKKSQASPESKVSG